MAFPFSAFSLGVLSVLGDLAVEVFHRFDVQKWSSISTND